MEALVGYCVSIRLTGTVLRFRVDTNIAFQILSTQDVPQGEQKLDAFNESYRDDRLASPLQHESKSHPRI